MNSARRSRRRIDWPRGLYEPRPGYYVWRHPDGRTLPIGRVPLAVARNEALAANEHISQTKPGLVEQIEGDAKTVADVLDRMPEAKAVNTQRMNKSTDKRIRESLGTKPVGQLTVADCAELIEGVVEEGYARTAQAVRSRLVAVCRRGMRLGWIDHNPAEVTGDPRVEVKRSRLTLEMFQAVYDKAPEVAEWLQTAMMLALVTGQDRSTVVDMQRAHIADGYLTVWRGKTRGTNRPVDIPLSLRMQAVGVTLSDLLKARTGVLSRFILHHVAEYGNAPKGSPVHQDTVSRSFTAARQLASIPDEVGGRTAPTFHEIRSLSKRLYEKQGGVDTKALLGHSTTRMSDLYNDPRGIEHIRVRVG